MQSDKKLEPWALSEFAGHALQVPCETAPEAVE